MATLTATTPTRTGTVTAGAAVAATDTIPAVVLGINGAYLEIINGNAAADNMTISDAGTTKAGSPLTGGTYTASVAAGASRVFYISPKQSDGNGDVTVTHSVTATVTYKLYPLG